MWKSIFFCVNYDARLSDFSSLTSGSVRVTLCVSRSVNSVVIPPSDSMSPNWNNPCRWAETHHPGQLSWWVQFNPPCDSDLSSPLAGTIWTHPGRDICWDAGEELWSLDCSQRPLTGVLGSPCMCRCSRNGSWFSIKNKLKLHIWNQMWAHLSGEKKQ